MQLWSWTAPAKTSASASIARVIGVPDIRPFALCPRAAGSRHMPTARHLSVRADQPRRPARARAFLLQTPGEFHPSPHTRCRRPRRPRIPRCGMGRQRRGRGWASTIARASSQDHRRIGCEYQRRRRHRRTGLSHAHRRHAPARSREQCASGPLPDSAPQPTTAAKRLIEGHPPV